MQIIGAVFKILCTPSNGAPRTRHYVFTHNCEYFSTFRKFFFFRNFSVFRGLGSARTSPRRPSCACASIFRNFERKKFFETFPSSAVWALRARPPVPLVRMREYFSTFRKFFFSKLFHLPRSGLCAHVPPAPLVRMREYFSKFRKNFFFRNFSILRGLDSARTSPRVYNPPQATMCDSPAEARTKITSRRQTAQVLNSRRDRASKVIRRRRIKVE